MSNVRAAISEKGLTQEQVASALGVSKQAVQKWARGGSMSYENLRKLAKLLGVSTDYLVGEENVSMTVKPYRSVDPDEPENPDFVRVPVLDIDASCGGGCGSHDAQIVAAVDFVPTFVRGLPGVTSLNQLHIVHASGDSMEPTILDRALALVDGNQRRITADGIYCIQSFGQIFLKRVQRNVSGTLTMISDNARYSPEEIGRDAIESMTIIGKVIYVFNGSQL